MHLSLDVAYTHIHARTSCTSQVNLQSPHLHNSVSFKTWQGFDVHPDTVVKQVYIMRIQQVRITTLHMPDTGVIALHLLEPSL